MPVTVSPARPLDLLPVFTALYGAAGDDLRPLVGGLAAAWVVRDGEGGVVGAVGLRPSPAHGAELVGGATPGPGQVETATALARRAREEAGRTYAFAEGHLFPLGALEAAGYRRVGAYRVLAGPTPTASVDVPEGLRLLSLSDVPDPPTRLAGLATYQDRIGHHTPMPEHADERGGGFDPGLSLIALDARGQAAGLCCATVGDDHAHIGSPGVRPDLRHTNLRAALLLGVSALTASRGLENVRVESWGDTPEEVAHDLGLGLWVEVEEPILAAG